jgi:predicted metal-dependent HD superfamily phosphohydrolase
MDRKVADRLTALAPEGMALPPRFLVELGEAYALPPRHYHALDHVVNMAEQFELVRRQVGWREPFPVYHAVLTHDAVYEPGKSDNESRSAELACSWADAYWPEAGWGPRAAFLVQSTAAHHALPTGEDEDLDHFLDCDLAILGAESATYDAYAAGIRAEYVPVAGDAFDAGRASFLRSLLERPNIFRSDFFRRRLDAAARDNLRRELSALE